MVKLLILPMDIRQEMLGSLRQVKNCLQIDDLCRSCRNIRILMCKAL